MTKKQLKGDTAGASVEEQKGSQRRKEELIVARADAGEV